jgi:hypothetical protein
MGCIFLVLIVGLGFGWFYFLSTLVAPRLKTKALLLMSVDCCEKAEEALEFTDVLLICMSENKPSCIRAPPDAEKQTK